jgi:hypothetical protein
MKDDIDELIEDDGEEIDEDEYEALRKSQDDEEISGGGYIIFHFKTKPNTTYELRWRGRNQNNRNEYIWIYDDEAEEWTYASWSKPEEEGDFYWFLGLVTPGSDELYIGFVCYPVIDFIEVRPVRQTKDLPKENRLDKDKAEELIELIDDLDDDELETQEKQEIMEELVDYGSNALRFLLAEKQKCEGESKVRLHWVIRAIEEGIPLGITYFTFDEGELEVYSLNAKVE